VVVNIQAGGLGKTLFFVIFLSLVPRFAYGESLDARKKTEKRCFSSFFSRLYHDLPTANRPVLGKRQKNVVFRHFSLACTTICLRRIARRSEKDRKTLFFVIFLSLVPRFETASAYLCITLQTYGKKQGKITC